MVSVLNLKKDTIPKDAVFVGRPSKWGNPYVIGRDGTRKQVIAKYHDYLYESGLINEVKELKGKCLVCYCAPLACHGDILLEAANAPSLDDYI